MSTRFTPIRGTEESIRNLNIEDGHIYFAFDTGHVYMDKDSETRIAISGRGSAVYLFDDTNVEVSTDYNGSYIFPVTSLSYPEFNSDTIKEEDIIINLCSGELFRVLNFIYRKIRSVDNVKCAVAEKIVLAGTSNSETPSGLNQISLELTSNLPYRFVYGKEAYASFIATAVGNDDINIRLVVIGADGSTHERVKMVQSGEEFDIEYGSLLFLGYNTIIISANGDNIVNSGTIEKRYRQRQATYLELRRPEGNTIYSYQTGEQVNFSYIPIGEVEKYVELYIDDNLVYTSDIIPSNISDIAQSIEITDTMILLGGKPLSGYHELKLKLKTATEDGTDEIEAEPLVYELAWVDENTSAPIIWFPNGIPESINQYSTYNLEYMVFDINQTKGINTILFKGEDDNTGVELSLDYVIGEPHIWVISELDVGWNYFKIKCGNTERSFKINCISLSGEKDLGIIKTGLILDLDAAGRSNSENVESRYSWPRGEKKVEDIKFNNFNWYNNGWITDQNGVTSLRISNGASISIPFNKLNSEQLEKNLALEFRFKIKNVKEYITLTTRGQSGNDTENTVLTLETENSVCGKFFGRQKGLLIGTQEAVFTYGPTLSVRYKEDEIIDLFLVFDVSNKLIYMYLNGILSAAEHYNSFANLDTKAKEITFNSKYCDLDLYSIRVYETDTPFSTENVVHNFIANLSGEERTNAYDINQIVSYNYDTKEPYIDYYKMIAYNEEHPDTPLMPYAIVKSLSSDDLLPYRKGDEKPCEITFVNPYLDYLWEHKDNIDQGKHPKIDGEIYLTSCPSFKYSSGTVKNFNVQGTSSQGYPRRNFKLKTKGCTAWYYTNGPTAARKDESGNILAEDLLQIVDGVTYDNKTYTKWYMDSSLPADKFCWKADYMESSGSYNTGFANFVSILYEHHPLYNVLNDVSYNTYRTSVYGFPMLVFQEKQAKGADEKTQYEFVGKYNFNLDKSSNTRYGFELKVKNQYLNKNIKDIAECWEFTNNQGTYCAFRTPWPDEELPENFNELESEEDKQAAISKCSFKPIAEDSFEYRYNADDKALDALSFKSGISIDNINPLVPIGGDPDKGYKPIRDYFTNFKILYEWLYNIGQIEDPTERQATFRAQFEQHLNKEYCFVYFILTELLHCYDSRGKNMMIATWGPEKAGGEYIWYPIFYDVDTQLGLNNSGEQLWDYYAEPTDNYDFSTSNSVLWNCLWEAYSTEIKEKYNSLRTADKISFENLNGYYNFNPEYTHSLAMKGQRPLVVYNIDEYYKYISPSLTGFIDTSGNIANDSFGHLYCLQGTRELSRALYLRNRINYLDSKWLGGAYAYTAVNGGGFETRLNANYLGKTSDIYIVSNTEKEGYIREDDENWPNRLDADPTFTVRPFLKQYVSVYYDKNPTEPIAGNNNSQINTFFKEVEKEYSISDDLEFLPGKNYYYLDNGNYILINLFDGNFFVAIPPNTTVTNQNYRNYYILVNNEYIKPYEQVDSNLVDENNYFNYYVKVDDITYAQAAVYELDKEYYQPIPFDNELTYYYRNIWECKFKVTINNYTCFYIKDDEDNYIQASKNEQGGYDDSKTYYELVELIGTEPVSSSTELVTIPPSATVLNAYKTTENHTQQLAYVTGAEYISDLGDLSTKYFNQFNIGGAYRLENLTLGSDVDIDGNTYKNEVLTNILLASSKDDPHPKTLLKKIVLNGLTHFNSFLDISGCEKLEEFRALRTALPQVAFADGVQLKTLHLPSSVNTLILKQANKLTKVINEANDNEGNPREGLFIDGLTNLNVIDENTTTNIIKISIEGDYLGYDSYKLLEKLVAIKQQMKQNNSSLDYDLSIGMRKINWSPYTLVPYGTEFDETKTYYLDSSRFTFENLSENQNKLNIVKDHWNQYLGNNLIFIKTDETYDPVNTIDYPITSLELLDTFINDINGKMEKADTQFSNDNPYEDQISLPDITGVLYIHNDIGLKETDLVMYKQYFPDLRIFCVNVIPGTKITYMYYKNIVPEEGDNNIIEWTDAATFSDNNIIITNTNPFAVMRQEHYVFNGWKKFDPLTLTIQEKVSDENGCPLDEDITIGQGNEYILIADFSKQVYNITFYYERLADGTPVESTALVRQIAYNDEITFPPITEYYPWEDDSELSYNETYQFIGYDKAQDNTTASFIPSRTSFPLATNHTKYYAIFRKVKVYNNPLNDDFLIYDSTDDKLYLNQAYCNLLKGKITIPTKIKHNITDAQKKPYSSFGSGLSDDNPFTKITHIFWTNDKNNTKLTKINDYCFQDWGQLRFIELPDSNSLTELGAYAFSITNDSDFGNDNIHLFHDFGKIQNVTSTEATQFALDVFFANITSIGDYCFAAPYNSSDSSRWQNCYIRISPNIKHMGEQVFASNRIWLSNVSNQYHGLWFGTKENPISSTFINNVISNYSSRRPIITSGNYDNDRIAIHKIYHTADISNELIEGAFASCLGNVRIMEGYDS